MRQYKVVFAPEFMVSLDRILSFMELTGASEHHLDRYQHNVLEFCQTMSCFPYRGKPRDDLAPGLRITHYRNNTVLPYAVDEDSRTIAFLGVYAARQDYEKLMMGE
jgi:plasmid stabilization system protein ParE